MPTFTDFLDNPIHVGDIVAIPFATGSSKVGVNLATVEVIDEIIPFDSNPTNTYGYLLKHRHRPVHERTRHEIQGKWKYSNDEVKYYRETVDPYFRNVFERDESKAYQLQVRHEGADKTSLIKRVDRVIVVTSLVNA